MHTMGLVLTRKDGQAVVINGGIIVRILIARHGNVRLAIDAPRDLCVLREELLHGDRNHSTFAGDEGCQQADGDLPRQAGQQDTAA